jgi:hypothetical protein
MSMRVSGITCSYLLKDFESQVIQKSLGASKSKGLNNIAKTKKPKHYN